MTGAEHASRQDATVNRERVLQAAFEVFAAKGTSASITDIASRAGVGAGTIYRHFGTKERLFQAVIGDRFARVVDYGTQLRRSEPPETALFVFLHSLIHGWSDNRALADAIIGSEFDLGDVEEPFIAILGDVLRDAQGAGVVRHDLNAIELKAVLAACHFVRTHDEGNADAVARVVFDGLRSRTSSPSNMSVDTKRS